MFFKVFDAEGRRLECCPEKGGRDPAAARTRLANRFPSSSSCSGGVGGSSNSAELLATPETSDDSYEPPSLHPEQGGLVGPPSPLICMGLAPVADGPLLMMASLAEARVVSTL